MKRIVFLALTACLLLAGCAAPIPEAETPSTTTSTTATTTANPAFIEEDKAIRIAEQHWGVRNGECAPETGFAMYLSFAEMPTADDPVYVVSLQWMVEDEDGQPSHLSRLDTVRIDAVTGEVITEPAG